MEKKMIRLLAERVLYRQDELVFVSCESNSIFSLDLINGDVRIRGFVRMEDLFGYRLFGGIFEYNDKFVLIPANSKHVVLLDREFNEEQVIEIHDSKVDLNYMSGVICKDRLFMFNHGVGANCIRCISLVDCSEIELNEIFGCYFFDCLVENNSVLLPSCNSNILIRLNLDTLEVEKHEVGKGNYNAIEKYNGDYYLAPREGNLLTIWKADGKIDEISIPKGNAIGVIKVGTRVFLPSNVAGGSLQVDQNGNVTKWHPEERFILSKRITENMYVLMNDRAKVYVLNLLDGCIVEYTTELQNTAVFIEETKNYYNKNSQSILQEVRLNNLKDYLNYMAEI